MKKTKPKGAIAAGHQVSADAAAQMLRLGGNAFDATLAALFAACVCEPVLSSLGGGGFLMAREATNKKTSTFDFFVQTPQKKQQAQNIEFKPIHVDFGATQQEFLIGMGASATPGFVSGCYKAHGALGTLPMASILQPAIDAAQNGVVMDGFQSRLFKIVEPILLNTVKSRALFAPNDRLLAPGELLVNPHLADTLKALAVEGPDFFYKGPVAEAITELSQHSGGHLADQDFSTYETVERAPLVQPFGTDGEIFLNPQPSAGGCLIGFGLELVRRLEDTGHLVNGLLLSNVLREIDHTRQTFFGNPDLMPIDNAVARAVKNLANRTITSKGTTHISVIDAEGNAAAATVSNGEGNGHMVGEFGFMLNNMLGEEDLNPKGFHQWPCDDRLSSMMAPTLVDHGQGNLSVLGSGGANRIRSAMLQVLLHLKAGVGAEQAVRAARMHYENGKLDAENWLDADAIKSLLAHNRDMTLWDQPNMFFGGVHMVQKTSEGWFAGAGDQRRNGCFMIVD